MKTLNIKHPMLFNIHGTELSLMVNRICEDKRFRNANVIVDDISTDIKKTTIRFRTNKMLNIFHNWQFVLLENNSSYFINIKN
jgi:hypothetical protein